MNKKKISTTPFQNYRNEFFFIALMKNLLGCLENSGLVYSHTKKNIYICKLYKLYSDRSGAKFSGLHPINTKVVEALVLQQNEFSKTSNFNNMKCFVIKIYFSYSSKYIRQNMSIKKKYTKRVKYIDIF